jgi:hypothetical protein
MGKEATIKYRKLSFQQLWKWPSCGWRFFKKQPILWVLTALIYMLVAMSVGMIPVVGSILVMLISPIVFASSMQWLASPELQKKYKKRFFDQLQQTLYGALKIQENIVPVLILGVFLAVSNVIIQIIGHLIAGSLFPSLAALPDLASAQIISVLSAKLFILISQFFIGMWVFYAIPIIILDDIILPEAVMKSFKGILANLLGILGLYFATLAPLILWSFFFSTANPIGFAGFLIIGTCMLSIFINSAYCGYKLTYYR